MINFFKTLFLPGAGRIKVGLTLPRLTYSAKYLYGPALNADEVLKEEIRYTAAG
jgi:hypothetical protein